MNRTKQFCKNIFRVFCCVCIAVLFVSCSGSDVGGDAAVRMSVNMQSGRFAESGGGRLAVLANSSLSVTLSGDGYSDVKTINLDGAGKGSCTFKAVPCGIIVGAEASVTTASGDSYYGISNKITVSRIGDNTLSITMKYEPQVGGYLLSDGTFSPAGGGAGGAFIAGVVFDNNYNGKILVVALNENSGCKCYTTNSMCTTSVPAGMSLSDGSVNQAIFKTDPLIGTGTYTFASLYPAAFAAESLGGGSFGWYLPSKVELKRLFSNASDVNISLSSASGDPLFLGSDASGTVFYWTSSVESTATADVIYNAGETLSHNADYFTHRVRAVCAILR